MLKRSTVFLLAWAATAATGGVGGGTRMLRTPTVSATQIAFAYANNIWVVERGGRFGAAAYQLRGADGESAFFAGWQAGRVQRGVRREMSMSTWWRRRAASRSG